MQQPPANVAIGDRFQDAKGNTHIVAELQDGYPFLLEDFELLEDPNGFEWDTVTWEWAEGHWGPLQSIDTNPEMTRIITARATREREMAEVTSTIPADRIRDLHNALAGASHWGSKLIEAQADVTRISGHRANELRKVVEIVGPQDKAAKLLGMNQSTLSRALRDRS